MKLGILVVYLVSPEADWVLEKHLEHLAKTKPFMSFKVYAAANRLLDRYRSTLRQFSFVEIIDLPSIELRTSGEHGTYLDMLAAHAVGDGCDYVCTFDVDSWPIRDDWIEVTWNLIEQNRAAAAAVLRVEDGDTILPHPSFTFLQADLLRHPECRFWLSRSDMKGDLDAFRERNNQRIDTGLGLGYFLHKHGLEWVKLRRSNKKDYHYLMAGIYGDLVFHVGAGYRMKIFSQEEYPWSDKFVRRLRSVPVIWRYRDEIKFILEKLWQPEIYRRNQAIFDAIASNIRTDEVAFYRDLLTG